MNRPIIEQLKELFPDLQEADAVRVLLFIGFEHSDIFEMPCFLELDGETIYLPSKVPLKYPVDAARYLQ